MSIVRSPRPETGWYALDKRISEDARLSWAARGLLVFLLGKPDNWRVSVEHLRRQTDGARVRTGRDGIYALLGELQAAGYIQAIQARRADGTLGPVEYQVRELPAPLPAEPETAEPHPAEPYPAEPTLTKTETTAKTEGEQPARKRAKVDAASTFTPPPWVPTDLWQAWLLTRTKKRVPNTERALELAVRQLAKLQEAGHVPAEVLEQSILCGWAGLFPVKRGHDHGTGGRNRRESEAERVERINREHDLRERAAGLL